MTEKKLSVLIIEDEYIFRNLAFQAFDGCEKISATNAEEGLKRFKEFSPDITLLDIGLPDKNGLDLLPQLIGHDPEAFIVMLTMSRVSEDVKLARVRGASGYIIKPFSFQKVEQCIANYNQYRKKLQSMSPTERAGRMVESLRIESLHEDLNRQIQPENKEISSSTEPSELDRFLQGWKILFADELLVNRERARDKLARLGSKIDLAESGADLLRKATSEFYNVVLISSQIKGSDGYEIAKRIRQKEYDMKSEKKSILIAMLENSDELERRLWQKAGMNDFIRKPASFTKIRETIKKHAQNIMDHETGKYI